jgi:hypothetical protein
MPASCAARGHGHAGTFSRALAKRHSHAPSCRPQRPQRPAIGAAFTASRNDPSASLSTSAKVSPSRLATARASSSCRAGPRHCVAVQSAGSRVSAIGHNVNSIRQRVSDLAPSPPAGAGRGPLDGSRIISPAPTADTAVTTLGGFRSASAPPAPRFGGGLRSVSLGAARRAADGVAKGQGCGGAEPVPASEDSREPIARAHPPGRVGEPRWLALKSGELQAWPRFGLGCGFGFRGSRIDPRRRGPAGHQPAHGGTARRGVAPERQRFALRLPPLELYGLGCGLGRPFHGAPRPWHGYGSARPFSALSPALGPTIGGNRGPAIFTAAALIVVRAYRAMFNHAPTSHTEHRRECPLLP